jgi:hypothetical protein
MLLKLVSPFYQASFLLGHAVDTARSIEWPDGVKAKQEIHARKGENGTLLSVEIREQDMTTLVKIYPRGKVEVSRASSEEAARRSMAVVSWAFQKAGCAPIDDVNTPETTFQITNIAASFEKPPGSTLMIHKEQTAKSLERKFPSVKYEPELSRGVFTLKLLPSNRNGEVTFQFNTHTVSVWGKELAEMEKLFHEEVYDLVTWKEPPTPAGAPVADGGGKTAAVKFDARAALDLAVKAIVGGLPPGPRANGGYPSRHAQIQKWLQQTRPDIKLPDYDPAWGAPGRRAHKPRPDRVWAGTPYEAFWDNNMDPALARTPVKIDWCVPPAASAATPAAAASTPSAAAASGAPAALSAEEAGGAASSAMDAPAEDASTGSELKRMHILTALAELEDQVASTSPPSKFSETVLDEMVKVMQKAQDEGRDWGPSEAELGASLLEQQTNEQGPVHRSLNVPSDEAQECTRFCGLSAEDGEPGGARRPTAPLLLPWPCTNRHRSSTGVEVPPGKKQKRSEASEAPRDVAARLLQDLSNVACPLPETADLHDECVRICMLIMRSR